MAHQISPPPVSFLSVFFPSPSCKERIFTVTCSHKREEKKKLCASHIRFRNSRVLSAQKVHPFSNQAFVCQNRSRCRNKNSERKQGSPLLLLLMGSPHATTAQSWCNDEHFFRVASFPRSGGPTQKSRLDWILKCLSPLRTYEGPFTLDLLLRRT